MSLKYNDANGVLHNVSGLNGQSGELVIGASTIRTGTFTVAATNGKTLSSDCVITFSSPMPDADYQVTFESNDNTGGYHAANIWAKTKNGFTVSFTNGNAMDLPATSIKYTAFKLYTDIEYNNLLTISTGTVTLDSTYVTSGTCTYMKCGHIVTARVSALTLKSGVVPGTVLGTGLPPLPDGFHRAIVAKGDGVSPCVFIRATSNGTLMADSGCDGATSLYGDFTYICQ